MATVDELLSGLLPKEDVCLFAVCCSLKFYFSSLLGQLACACDPGGSEFAPYKFRHITFIDF